MIGCGDLGSRHLQAAVAVHEIGELHVIDPNPASIELAKTRIFEVADRNKDMKIFWHDRFISEAGGGDLCIIPTQARVRPEVFRRASEELGYKKFFIEKIVADSMQGFDDMLILADRKELKVWVNCQTRTYSIHAQIKKLIDPSESVTFLLYGGNHGLACNGVHAADLFLFYDGSDEIKGSSALIDDILHPVKRGKDLFDLSGTLTGYTRKGSRCIISFSPGQDSPANVIIMTRHHKFFIDHTSAMAMESHAKENWVWKERPWQENILVSFMSKKFIRQMLLEASSALPTLEQTRPSHQFILEGLLPHFNRLMRTSNNYCPVT